MKTFPTLYRKTNTGAIQNWTIKVMEREVDDVVDIFTHYGQVGGKEQVTMDTVAEGKNLGKKNATTPYTQAEADAQSKWESKLKEGYVQSIEDAEAGKVDSIIEGGMDPMLAHSFAKAGDKITYPCFSQPKLDGIRCIAIKKGNEVTLWSRSRKRINSCPHIEQAVREIYSAMDEVTLDGELYNHDLKNDFEKIISAVRTDEPTENSKLAQYHVYDFIPTVKLGFRERIDFLEKTIYAHPDLKLVQTIQCETAEVLLTSFFSFTGNGYEGAIARNAEGLYEHKRSNHLQKIKEFLDDDFEIVGVSEGKGKLIGNVGAFICQTSGGVQFEAKPKGNQDSWKPYLTNSDLWKGKKLVVQYQGLTNKNKVPRFPVGIRLKNEVEG